VIDPPGFWSTAFDAALCLMILVLAWRVVFTTDLFRAGLTFFAFGLMVALAWARLQAVDVALAEAAIGGGLTGALFLAAFARRAKPGGEETSEPARAADEQES
jgi:uncharacterized MnhB-related membrane protein